MSLIKQLWIAVGALMFLALLTSFSISTYSAGSYYEEQLRLKNIDNANSLALMISQMEKDQVMIELLVAAQFDTGHYSRITLFDPQEDIYLEKRYQDSANQTSVPTWFREMVDLNVEPGVAQIQDGWHQFGTLYVESDARFAYESLWTTTQQFLFWFAAVSVVLGLIGTFLLKAITRPLDDVVAQAEAIGGRRFITSHEPKTLEFGRVVRAMNILSERIRQMLETESRRLEEMRYKNQHDALTGLANREHFNHLLEAVLNDDEQNAQHGLILVRLTNLQEINQVLGHQKTDQLICRITQGFDQVAKSQRSQYNQVSIGRLNGRDFALMFTDLLDFTELAEALLKEMKCLVDEQVELQIQLPIAGCPFHPGEGRGEVLMKLDNLLAQAESEPGSNLYMTPYHKLPGVLQGSDKWREILARALKEKALRSAFFPVLSLESNLIHQEAMMRLHIDGETHSAGYFIPWVKRLQMMPQFELAMLEQVLMHLSQPNQREEIAVNLSMETLKDSTSHLRLFELLEQYKSVASHLWLEFVEHGISDDVELFKAFCHRVKSYGCKLGLEQAGSKFAKIANLQELGMDYLKLDAAFTQELDSQHSNYDFVRGLTTLAHSIGLVVMATGVQSKEESKVLQAVGIDAMTGPGVKH